MDRHRHKPDSWILIAATLLLMLGAMGGDCLAATVDIDLQRVPVSEWQGLVDDVVLRTVQEVRDQLGFEPVVDPGLDGTPGLAGNDTFWVTPLTLPAERDLVVRGAYHSATSENSLGLIVDPNEFAAPEPGASSWPASMQ